MQDESVEPATSISQLLRDSYLAERGISNGNSEKNDCCASSAGLPEEGKNQEDLSDLSAFLSQEELDKSVNLAIQEIHHSPHEIKQDKPQTQTIYPPEEMSQTLKTGLNKNVPQLAHAPTSSEKDHPSDNPGFCQDHVLRANKGCTENSQDQKKEHGPSPYACEKDSKKEFRNKAADFIEELSSLFKSHNSKKIRPKTCKRNRSKRDSQSGLAPGSSSPYTNMTENRERLPSPIPTQAIVEVDAPLETFKNEEDKDLENETESKDTGSSSETPQPSLYFEEAVGQPPNFIQKLKSREILEGARVQLDCTVIGFPVPEVSWYCEGKELENSPDIQITKEGNVHSFVISEAFQEDTGRYSCFASNIYGTDSTSAEIYIEGASSSESEADRNKEDMDEVVKSPSDTDASAAVPPPLNSAVIHQEVHKGEAREAEPAVAPKASSMPIRQPIQNPTSYLQGLDGKPIIAAPVFTKTLLDISAKEGQLVVFECRVKGAPSPKLEWYREGSLIEDSPDFRILQKKPRSMAEPAEICTLVIAEVFSEDSGSFTCTASNKYGTVSSIGHLNVKGSEVTSDNASLTMNSINALAFKNQDLPPNPDKVPTNPANSPLDRSTKLKLEGVLVNHSEPRTSSKVGLRVHFKLPEDEQGSEDSSEEGTVTSDQFNSDTAQGATSPSKDPPPVLAKPKLGAVQLKQLHNQVLLEQQQIPVSSSLQLSNDTDSYSSFSSLIQQQPISTANQPSAPSPPETFMYTRPKGFLAAQKTTTYSPLSPTGPLPGAIFQRIQSPPTIAESTFPSPLASGGIFQRIQSPPNIAESTLPSPLASGGIFQRVQSPSTIADSMFPPSLFSFSSQNQFQTHSVSLCPLSPTPRIQDPAAFLSSVLPSFPATPLPTNYMGLPRGAPILPSRGMSRKSPKPLRLDLFPEKDVVLEDLKRTLYYKDRMFNQHQQEYKISSFEQRLMNEIEFRLERTPVDESDEDVEHDEIPTGKCLAPVFDRRIKHFRVIEGTAVTFTCKVVGIPVPKVYWFKDGKQISKKNQHCIMKRGSDGTCSLHIETATNDDDGNYTIMAANPQGKISCSGHLLVQTAPLHHPRVAATVHSHRVRSHLQEVEGEPHRFFRPYFLQAPGDMVAHEGRLCRLDCKVSGLPTPDLLWHLNGRPVVADETHRLLVTENGIYSLIIDPLMQKDAGTYTCIAKNKTGQNSFNLELNVVAREVKKSPMFLEKLQNCGVPEGHPVRLESRVIGMPTPVFYWKKDNETIPCNDHRVSMHQDMTGYVCLLIQPTRKGDAGWYTLSAKNEAGIASCTARLDIYAQWYHQIPQPIKTGRSTGSRYASLTGQGLDIFSAFPSLESPVSFLSSSQDYVESEEL